MNEPSFVIYPPVGTVFNTCPLCQNPFIDDGKAENCLWCEIHKEEPKDG